MTQPPSQASLLQPLNESSGGPVTCLGMTFASDAERRAHFTELLAEKLKDPEFRKIEGFPLGSDDDILALSDPPFFTACPNPWIADFVAEWKKQMAAPSADGSYHREPFAADVSEGKYDPIYKYHPYPTKVPHKAIMRYVLHYTEPGDIVFDGFSGTGMTGVASQLCGDRDVVAELGYRVENDGTILRPAINEADNSTWEPFSHLGVRHAVLNDLSPAASYIAYNYNMPPDSEFFNREALRILAEVEKECGWMYETKHSDGRTGKINYTVWSDVFVCPTCTQEVIFWDAAVNKAAGKVKDEFPCPNCGAELTKRSMERAWDTYYDNTINQVVRQAKQVPVHINYEIGGRRAEKSPDESDLALLEKIRGLSIPHWIPSDRMIVGKESRRNDPIGISHVHQFYTSRNLWVLAKIRSMCTTPHRYLLITKVSLQITKLYRYTYQSGVWGAGGGPLSGTLYIPSLVKELNIIEQVRDSLRSRRTATAKLTAGNTIGSCQSTTSVLELPNESIDYIFVDPPFGANLNYSELANLWESWLRVWTNNNLEAIENDVQGKGPTEYRRLMTECFQEAYRVLKPGRWMTVEFSNTKASVWNNIQTALSDAGFIVANVSALDKKKASFKAVTTPTAVKQDLVISAYKPNGGFEERFQQEFKTEEGVWDFVQTHLQYLPVIKRDADSGRLVMIPERDPRILFDQMVAYYVRKNLPVKMNSQKFQIGLAQRFPFRDGMYFLPEQVVEYDKKRFLAKEVEQAALFVADESSAIAWLRQLLQQKPQTFQEIHPQFIPELGGWNKTEQPLELSLLPG